MCFRSAVLLKSTLVRQRDKQERLWNAYKVDGVLDAMKRAEHEAKLYLESAEGQLWLEDTAYEQAEAALLESGANKVVEKRHQDVEAQKRAVIAKFDKKKYKIQKVRDNKLQQIQASLDQLKADKQISQEGYVRNALEQRIQALTVRQANLPETTQLQQLQIECERSCAMLDGGMYEDDSVNTSEEDSSEFSTDDDSPEAQRWRQRIKRRLVIIT
jgi:hypothetical protein